MGCARMDTPRMMRESHCPAEAQDSRCRVEAQDAAHPPRPSLLSVFSRPAVSRAGVACVYPLFWREGGTVLRPTHTDRERSATPTIMRKVMAWY